MNITGQRGCYIYMLSCSDGGPSYIKIGMSNSPVARLGQILTGCPIKPISFACVELRTRDRARRAEAALHRHLEEWRSTGEWFRVDPSDRGRFDSACRAAVSRFSEPTWPMVWDTLSVQDYLAESKQAGRRGFWAARKRDKSRGKPYKDFVLHGGAAPN